MSWRIELLAALAHFPFALGVVHTFVLAATALANVICFETHIDRSLFVLALK